MRGIIVKVEWHNPHVYFYLDVTVAGETEMWAFEMVSPLVLERRGWTRHTLEIGEMVEVEAFPARNGSFLASADSIVLLRTGQRLSGTLTQ